MLESRIAELEKMLKHARVLDSADIDTSVISVGSHVKFRTKTAIWMNTISPALPRQTR